MARELKINITSDADTKGFKKTEDAVGRTEKVSDRAKGPLGNLADTLKSRLGPAGGVAGGAIDKVVGAVGSMPVPVLAAAGAAAAGATALLKFGLAGAAAFNETAQAAIKFSRQAGVSVEEGSRLAAVVDDFGVSAEQTSKGVGKLADNIGRQPELFDEYGVTIAKTDQGLTDVMGTLGNLADAYVRTEDPARRVAMVQELMGRGGKELVPILEKGGAALREWMAAVDESQVITGDEAARAEEYREAMDRLGDSFSDLQVEVGQRLVPALSTLGNVGATALEGLNRATDWVDEKTDKVGGFGGVLESLANGAMPGVGSAFGFLADKSNEAAEAQAQVERRVDDAREAMLREVDATQELEQAIDGMVEASMAAVNSQLGLERANKQVSEATAELTEKKTAHTDALKKHKAGSDEAKQAADDLARAETALKEKIVSSAEASVRHAEVQAKMNGETLTAEETAKIYKDRLIELGNAAGGPVKDQVLTLADIVKDPGWAEKQVKITVQSEAAEAELRRFEDRLRRMPNANVSIGIGGSGSVVQRRAAGGPVRSGHLYEVAEGDKAEILKQGGRTYLIPGQDGAVVPLNDRLPSAPMRAASGSAPQLVVNVNAPIMGWSGGQEFVRWLHDQLLRIQGTGGTLGFNS